MTSHGFTARPTRRLVLGALGAVVALTVAACSSSGGSSTPPAQGSGSGSGSSTAIEHPDLNVTFGTNSASTLPLWIAADQGFFKKNGLNVKVSQATSSVGALAVVSGKADIYLGEATTTFQAAASGQPVELVGNLRILNVFKFYVQPSIKTAADLKGKSIAISAQGDSTDLSTRIAMQELGSSIDGITLLPIGTSGARIAALESGKVAGTLLTEPTASQAAKDGMKLLLDQTDKPFLGSGITITKSFGDKYPNTVLAFLKSIVEATKYLQDPANKTTCINILAKYSQEKPNDPDVTEGYATYAAPGALVMDPTPNVAGGNALLAGLKAEDSSRFASLKLSDVFNDTFTNELKSSGFLKQVWGSALTASPSASPAS